MPFQLPFHIDEGAKWVCVHKYYLQYYCGRTHLSKHRVTRPVQPTTTRADRCDPNSVQSTLVVQCCCLRRRRRWPPTTPLSPQSSQPERSLARGCWAVYTLKVDDRALESERNCAVIIFVFSSCTSRAALIRIERYILSSSSSSMCVYM